MYIYVYQAYSVVYSIYIMVYILYSFKYMCEKKIISYYKNFTCS